MLNFIEIGRTVVVMRERKGLTQEKLALEAEMSVTYLRRIEHGRANPTLRALDRVAAILGMDSVDYTNKSAFSWISVIRLPDFISKADFDWAVETATKKKKLDCSSAEYLTIDEGLCVQIMHIGSFDNEPATVALMDAYLEQNGYVNDINKDRLHHEIYISDARKVAPEKWKTVIRHPIKKA